MEPKKGWHKINLVDSFFLRNFANMFFKKCCADLE